MAQAPTSKAPTPKLTIAVVRYLAKLTAIEQIRADLKGGGEFTTVSGLANGVRQGPNFSGRNRAAMAVSKWIQRESWAASRSLYEICGSSPNIAGTLNDLVVGFRRSKADQHELLGEERSALLGELPVQDAYTAPRLDVLAYEVCLSHCLAQSRGASTGTVGAEI